MAPLALTTGSGLPIKMGEQLGRGGEGSVFATSQTGLCAKIYHAPLSQERADKIRLMASQTVSALTSVASWPVDLITDAKGRPVGLMMPRVDDKKDVHKLYSPKSRRQEFQRADWRFLVRTCANIARAFAQLHQHGCVIGDVNHGSVLVGQDARVTLIDCDSFQVVSGSRRYLCEVGVDNYTPPELQGRPLAGIVRTPDHDNFGLAVMVFNLLMMGRHPFAGRYGGAGDMPIPKAIEERRFVYGRNAAAVLMQRPPGAPDLAIVGPAVAGFFETAFTTTDSGRRPAAKTWVEELVRLEADTRQCKRNEAHWHLSSLGSCPWCAMEVATGTPLFPFVVQTTGGALGFDVLAFAQRLITLRDLGPAPVVAPPTVAPSKTARVIRREQLKLKLGCISLGAVILMTSLAFGAVLLALGGVGLAFVLYTILDKSRKPAEAIKADAEAAERSWRDAAAAWERQCSGERHDRKQSEFRAVKAEWDKLPQERLRRLQQLDGDRRRLQLERHLDQHYVETATIPGIGRGRKDSLRSESIETALDIDDRRLVTIPGFGPATRAKLLAWRLSVEQTFVFDPLRGVDAADVTAVEQAICSERRRLAERMQKIAEAILQEHARVTNMREQMRPRMEAVTQAHAQAQADLKAVA